MKTVLTILTVIMVILQARAQKENSSIIKGNQAYRAKEYTKAGEFYKQALEQFPGNQIAQFNLGNTLFRDNMGSKAIGYFESVAKGSTELNERADAYYNKGVVLSSQKKLPESIEAYKAALRLNPTDSLARQNLQRALNEQKQQQNKDKQQQQKKQEKLNKQQVMQMLAALQEQEKLLQQKLNRSKVPSPTQPGKDW